MSPHILICSYPHICSYAQWLKILIYPHILICSYTQWLRILIYAHILNEESSYPHMLISSHAHILASPARGWSAQHPYAGSHTEHMLSKADNPPVDICICICFDICICLDICIFLDICFDICICVDICICLDICICISFDICICVDICISVDICICLDIFICICFDTGNIWFVMPICFVAIITKPFFSLRKSVWDHLEVDQGGRYWMFVDRFTLVLN